MSTPETAIPDHLARATITAAARIMYPHDALPDDVYAQVGDQLAQAPRTDTGTAQIVRDGVADLNRDQTFAGLPAGRQLKALEGIEGSDFFELVRSAAVVAVYSDPRTWRLIGYEGPSFDQGGYLHRGFNDLNWLPDPEAAP
jgi:hypothetical protein